MVTCGTQKPGTVQSWYKLFQTNMSDDRDDSENMSTRFPSVHTHTLLIFTIHEFNKEREANLIESFCLHSIQFLLFFLFFFQSILQRISKAGPLLLGMLGFEDTNTCWVHPSPAGTAGLYHKVLSFLSFYSFLCLVRFKHQNYLG